jgi:hypothetical protein
MRQGKETKMTKASAFRAGWVARSSDGDEVRAQMVKTLWGAAVDAVELFNDASVTNLNSVEIRFLYPTWWAEGGFSDAPLPWWHKDRTDNIVATLRRPELPEPPTVEEVVEILRFIVVGHSIGRQHGEGVSVAGKQRLEWEPEMLAKLEDVIERGYRNELAQNQAAEMADLTERMSEERVPLDLDNFWGDVHSPDCRCRECLELRAWLEGS